MSLHYFTKYLKVIYSTHTQTQEIYLIINNKLHHQYVRFWKQYNEIFSTENAVKSISFSNVLIWTLINWLVMHY